MRHLLLHLAAVAVGLAAGRAYAADRPLGGDLLRLRDPAAAAGRRVLFRAARDPALATALADDPRTVGATLSVAGTNSGDGNSGTIELPAAGWSGLGRPAGSKGFRFVDRSGARGIRKLVLRTVPAGGTLTVAGGGPAWPYAIAAAAGPDRPPPDGRRRRAVRAVHQLPAERPRAGGGPAGAGAGRLRAAGAALRQRRRRVPRGVRRRQHGRAATAAPATAGSRTRRRCAPAFRPTSGTALARVLVASGLEKPVHVTAPPLDPTPAVRRRAGGPHPDRRATACWRRRRSSPSSRQVRVLRRARPAGRRLPPDYGRTAASSSTTPTHGGRPGDRAVPRERRRPTSPTRRASRCCSPSRTRPYATTTAASSPSAPTATSTSARATAAAAAIRCENAQDATTAARQAAAHRRRGRGAAVLRGAADNPFVGPAAALRRDLGDGLRNPWRFSFDRADRRPLHRRRGPGRVGGGRRPAAPRAPAARTTAGTSSRATALLRAGAAPTLPGPPAGLTLPVLEYAHSDGLLGHRRLRLPRLPHARRCTAPTSTPTTAPRSCGRSVA